MWSSQKSRYIIVFCGFFFFQLLQSPRSLIIKQRAVSKWKCPWWRRLTGGLPWGSLYNWCLEEALEQPSPSALREDRRGSLFLDCVSFLLPTNPMEANDVWDCDKPWQNISPAQADGMWTQLAYPSSCTHPFFKLQSPSARSYLHQEHPKLCDVSAGELRLREVKLCPRGRQSGKIPQTLRKSHRAVGCWSPLLNLGF